MLTNYNRRYKPERSKLTSAWRKLRAVRSSEIAAAYSPKVMISGEALSFSANTIDDSEPV